MHGFAYIGIQMDRINEMGFRESRREIGYCPTDGFNPGTETFAPVTGDQDDSRATTARGRVQRGLAVVDCDRPGLEKSGETGDQWGMLANDIQRQEQSVNDSVARHENPLR